MPFIAQVDCPAIADGRVARGAELFVKHDQDWAATLRPLMDMVKMDTTRECILCVFAATLIVRKNFQAPIRENVGSLIQMGDGLYFWQAENMFGLTPANSVAYGFCLTQTDPANMYDFLEAAWRRRIYG